VTGRFVVSLAWPGLIGPRYFWEHCHWVDTTDFPNDPQMFNAVLADMRLLYTNQVKMEGVRWYQPGTTIIYYQQLVGFPTFGAQAAQPNYNLLIAARWRLFGSDGSYSYHLHRQPVGEGYIEAGGWSATGRTQQQTRMNTFIGQGIYRTGTGALINSGDLADSPTQWQMRHGTKRRNSRFWIP